MDNQYIRIFCNGRKFRSCHGGWRCERERIINYLSSKEKTDEVLKCYIELSENQTAFVDGKNNKIFVFDIEVVSTRSKKIINRIQSYYALFKTDKGYELLKNGLGTINQPIKDIIDKDLIPFYNITSCIVNGNKIPGGEAAIYSEK